MPVLLDNYQRILAETQQKDVTLVVVSKTKPAEDIQALYELGQRDFGENYVQELLNKQSQLPTDIRWHFIGHLQTNKIKYIAPFVHLIHGIDNENAISEVNKQAMKLGKPIGCLMQVHIAQEETKFGWSISDVQNLLESKVEEKYPFVTFQGLMGMSSLTEDAQQIRTEFKTLKTLFDNYKTNTPTSENWNTLSMGMSGDYTIAMEEGSTLIRVGSLILSSRS